MDTLTNLEVEVTRTTALSLVVIRNYEKVLRRKLYEKELIALGNCSNYGHYPDYQLFENNNMNDLKICMKCEYFVSLNHKYKVKLCDSCKTNILLEEYYNEKFNSIEEPFNSIDDEYKKSIENTIGFQIFQSQKKLNIAIDDFKKSCENNIKDMPFLKRFFYKLRFKLMWRKLMNTKLDIKLKTNEK